MLVPGVKAGNRFDILARGFKSHAFPPKTMTLSSTDDLPATRPHLQEEFQQIEDASNKFIQDQRMRENAIEQFSSLKAMNCNMNMEKV